MNKHLETILTRPDFAHAPQSTDSDRYREMSIVLGCAGVGAAEGEALAYLGELKTFITARAKGASVDEAILHTFPPDEAAA